MSIPKAWPGWVWRWVPFAFFRGRKLLDSKGSPCFLGGEMSGKMPGGRMWLFEALNDARHAAKDAGVSDAAAQRKCGGAWEAGCVDKTLPSFFLACSLSFCSCVI